MACGCIREGLGVRDGFAFGIGLMVALKIVDAVFGPSDVKKAGVPSSQGTPAAAADLMPGTNRPGTTVTGTDIPGSHSPRSNSPGVSNACDDQFQALKNCLYSNRTKIGRCQPYWDKLQECRLCSAACPHCTKEHSL